MTPEPPPIVEGCGHLLGKLPCINGTPHPGHGRGCIHDAGSWVPDRHDLPGRDDNG